MSSVRGVNVKHLEQWATKELIGKNLTDATALTESHGCRLRVRVRNGQGQMGTADFRLDRINVGIDDDVVTSIQGVG